jgi:hypothetical protein
MALDVERALRQNPLLQFHAVELDGLLEVDAAVRRILRELVQYQGKRGIMAKIYGYGGMQKSQFDVSGGARIVDRFIFNQLRNAQRVKVWPSDN